MVESALARCKQSFVSWEEAQHNSNLTTSLDALVKHVTYKVVFITLFSIYF